MQRTWEIVNFYAVNNCEYWKCNFNAGCGTLLLLILADIQLSFLCVILYPRSIVFISECLLFLLEL